MSPAAWSSSSCWGAAQAPASSGWHGTIAAGILITTPTMRPGGFATASARRHRCGSGGGGTLKAAVLVWLLLAEDRRKIDGTHDGVVYGSMVASASR